MKALVWSHGIGLCLLGSTVKNDSSKKKAGTSHLFVGTFALVTIAIGLQHSATTANAPYRKAGNGHTLTRRRTYQCALCLRRFDQPTE